MFNDKVSLINIDKLKPLNFEFVERKGSGHPDTLADALAEELSRTYSNYTILNFGVILHHNFDKVGLLGGKSYVKLGEGYLIKPIRVLLNGRASTRFGDKEIPLRELLENTAKDFLIRHFPNIGREKDIEILYNISNSGSPGGTEELGVKSQIRKYWFEPRGLQDLPELVRLASNDTSLGCSYAPLSLAETIVLKLEKYLNSTEYKNDKLWLGSDIKIMASKLDNLLDITIALPQIADYVPDARSYKDNIETVKQDVLNLVKQIDSNIGILLHINTRDNFETNEFYLTAIGSSIETGDEGLVGRGNRINGLITPCRPMSIEGACGKNPVYHVGKLYNIVARLIAQRIHELTQKYVEVYIVSQSGRDLLNPWKTFVAIENSEIKEGNITSIVEGEINNIPKIKDDLLKGKISLY